MLAGFSFRGPSGMGVGQFANLTKPDITGPGVDIYAASPGACGTSYGFLSGTSMSSPHTAGSAALVRAVRPTWTATEVKSALMMTGFQGGTRKMEPHLGILTTSATAVST